MDAGIPAHAAAVEVQLIIAAVDDHLDVDQVVAPDRGDDGGTLDGDAVAVAGGDHDDPANGGYDLVHAATP